MHLWLVGINHRSAPVAVRERLAFDEAATRRALEAFDLRWPLAEGLLISTCNRVEWYVAADETEPSADSLADFLAQVQGLTVDQFETGLYTHADRQAVQHLMSVVSGLDSLVVGESQITGQVKEAYVTASAVGTTGTVLHRLFQRAFHVAKEVRTTTDIARHPVSVGSMAAAFAARVLGGLADKTILVIGAGETAELTYRHVSSLGAARRLVTNRTRDRAAALVARRGGEVAPFEALADHLAEADLVISATGAPRPILTAAMVRAALRRRRAPLCLIDLAVPRDVEPAVAALPGVHLYNLDDLDRAAQENRRRRHREIEVGLALVEREADLFLTWMNGLSAGSVVRALRARLHDVRQAEVDRLLARLDHLSSADREAIALMTRRLVNKLLHQPVTVLRRSAARGRGSPYNRAVRDLFGIDGD